LIQMKAGMGDEQAAVLKGRLHLNSPQGRP